MKTVPCNGPTCASRRIHHESAELRGVPRQVEVPPDHEGSAYCSIECYLYWCAENDKEPFPSG